MLTILQTTKTKRETTCKVMKKKKNRIDCMLKDFMRWNQVDSTLEKISYLYLNRTKQKF